VYFQNLSKLLRWPPEVKHITIFADAALVVFNKTGFMYRWLWLAPHPIVTFTQLWFHALYNTVCVWQWL